MNGSTWRILKVPSERNRSGRSGFLLTRTVSFPDNLCLWRRRCMIKVINAKYTKLCFQFPLFDDSISINSFFSIIHYCINKFLCFVSFLGYILYTIQYVSAFRFTVVPCVVSFKCPLLFFLFFFSSNNNNLSLTTLSKK